MGTLIIHLLYSLFSLGSRWKDLIRSRPRASILLNCDVLNTTFGRDNALHRGQLTMSHTALIKKKKILVVEDQTDLLELLRLQFKEEGFAIATATNGMEAVRKARSLVPDLILLDVMLPELDGFAVCELLRRDPATSAIPVIMVSGLSGQLPRCA